ncbi:MAG: hypothetical protein NTW86_07525 [Candidatus Sumerlaeota bacterium]|nr:hypothetical protein [Candidatus Sumerlaeota bacterium]
MKSLSIVVLCCLAWPVGATAADLSSLEVFQKGAPRAFFFRQTEGSAATGSLPFEQWEARFLPLNGVMGKAQDEEVPGRSASAAYFTRFKQAHPEKAVFLHYNGNARDPRDGAKFFAGHWLYFNGCGITDDMPAAEGESTIHVEDPSLFAVNMGRYKNKNEDIGMCVLGADGKPDWNQAEQLELLAVDEANKTLRVKRGAFGTKPLAFQKGKAYLAAHMTEGPWGAKSNLLWFYNYSTTCPKDPRGRTCADVLVEDLNSLFQPGGALEAFDGLEFDVMGFTKKGRGGARGADADVDGKSDGGYVGGLNAYGIGVYRFHEQLRKALGDNRIIMADGAGPNHQRSFGVLNGIESEGWPTLSDEQIIDWSGGLNRHFYWRDHAREPKLNYINHKFREGDKTYQAPMNINRLVLAVAQMTDAAITFSSQPPKPEISGIWDELRMGEENRTNWLGKALGEPIRLGVQTPDLLSGAGQRMTAEFVSRWASEDATISAGADGKSLVIAAKPEVQAGMTVAFRGLKAGEGDLLVYAEIAAETMKGYPEAIPRLVWLGCEGAGQLIRQKELQTGMILRGKSEQPLDPDTGATVKYVGATQLGDETHEAYQIHPPYRNRAAGAVYWEETAVVPEAPCALEFCAGLREAPGKSDGVVFSIEVIDGGKKEEVFNEWHKEFVWKQHKADLGKWAGKTVTLRFSADCGPNDNATADHGFWGDVYITTGAPQFHRSPLSAGRVMAFAGKPPFPMEGYFRDAGPATIDLTLQIEGTEPVTISNLTIHSAADAMAREFEHGVVLVNPSLKEYSFALAKLFPNAKLRRFQGTAGQDPQTNNGQPVGAAVTLGERDGLFLAKE